MSTIRLFSALLICSMPCLVMMWFVQNNLSYTQSSIDDNRTGATYFLLQTHYSLDEFTDVVERHLTETSGTSNSPGAVEAIRKHFNELSNAFFAFNAQAAPAFQSESELNTLVDRTQQLLNTHPGLNSEQSIDTDVLEKFLSDSQALSADIRQFGKTYFIAGADQSSTALMGIDRLSGYMRLLFAVIFLTSALGMVLLIRSNVRTNKLFKEAQQARGELALTVDELRSGRREQKAKDSFVAAASHDLRQPLHALGLFLNTLKNEIKPSGEYALKEAINCVNSLNHLFNGMLDLSELDAGVVSKKPENFDLQIFLANLHSQLEPSARSRNIELTNSGPKRSIVNSDPMLLERIIRNLVENAITHSGASNVTIRHHANKADYKISIIDNGCGIEAHEQEAIFNEYYQVGTPNPNRSIGLGLGLSIVQRLSALLELNLVLDSRPGTDTEFSMVVPAGDPSYREPDSDQPSDAVFAVQQTGAVIVVIDDDNAIRDAMCALLRTLNHQAVCAEDAEDALEQLIDRQLDPDLIIADYRLRNSLTGDVAIYQLRDAIERDIPALVVTGDTSPAKVIELTSTGFEILHKPVDTDLLHSRINALLSGQKPVDPENDNPVVRN